MHKDGYFDARLAASYDARHRGNEGELVAMVDRLQALADGGAALEFAIGTGRVALPLIARGVKVAGIELSQAMIDRLRAKPGGEDIPVTLGDMATANAGGEFALVFLVYNTINNLTSQAAQTACFRNAANHLHPGGHFVIEVGVPPLQSLPPGQEMLTFDASPEHWGADEIDVVSQEFTSHHLWFEDGEVERHSIPFRYVWPSELDLMAEIAGLEPAGRWGDWAGAPFTSASRRHISVWRKPL